MKLWKQTTETPERKGQPLVALQLGGQAAWSGRDYNALAREGYQKNVIAYRCVRLIAEAAASVTLCVRRGEVCETDDPAATLLASGNPGATPTDILEQFYGYLQVSGNAYLEAALVGGAPAALYALRPNRVSPIVGHDGWPAGYEYQTGQGTPRKFLRDNASGRCAVHHMRLFHPASNLAGYAPMAAAANAIDIHNEGGRWTKALLDNSARPSGALVLKDQSGSLSEAQFARLKNELDALYTGAAQAGRPIVLEGGMEWRPMSLTPSNMDFIEARREAAREIALAFGIPPMLLGIPGDNTYANYKEANQALWRQTIVPLVTKTARGLTDWLAPFYGDDLNITPDLDGVTALAEERAALWARLNAASFLSDAERRSLAGLEANQ